MICVWLSRHVTRYVANPFSDVQAESDVPRLDPLFRSHERTAQGRNELLPVVGLETLSCRGSQDGCPSLWLDPEKMSSPI